MHTYYGAGAAGVSATGAAGGVSAAGAAGGVSATGAAGAGGAGAAVVLGFNCHMTRAVIPPTTETQPSTISTIAHVGVSLLLSSLSFVVAAVPPLIGEIGLSGASGASGVMNRSRLVYIMPSAHISSMVIPSNA